MKLHPLAFACGTALAVTACIILMSRSPSSREPVQEMREIASERGPSNAKPGSPGQDPCLHLHRVICAEQGPTEDSTGIVRPDVDGEKMAIDLLGKIAQQHPEYNQDQLDEAVAEQIYTPAVRARIQSTFRWVRHTIIQFIESQPDSVFTAWEKHELTHRLRQIVLELPPPATVYADEPDLITKNDVFYERTMDGKMRLRVGGAYFYSAESWFNMVFTMGHEIGHSIDPCEVRSARLAFPAYDRLTACFLKQKLVALRDGRVECGVHDQLSETFADWIGVHVTAKALRNYATEFRGPMLVNAVINSVRDLCDTDDEEMDDDYHPSPAVRLDRIFGRNPEIREVLGCDAQKDPTRDALTYCDFNYQIGNNPGSN